MVWRGELEAQPRALNFSPPDTPPTEVRLGDLLLESIGYADDLIIFVHSLQDLQKRINQLATYYDKWGLTVNLKKTKVMRLVGRGGADKIRFKGRTVEWVESYRYLSCEVFSDMNPRKSVTARLEAAERGVQGAIDSVRCGLVLCKQCAEAIASNRRPPDALVLRWNGDPRMTEAYSPLLPIPEVLTPDWTTDLGIVDAALIASLIAKVRIVAWIFKVTPAGIEVSRQSALRGHQHIRGGKTFFPQDVNAIQACLEARE
uniref:Reverse transcriptase domain-containing protein n=1 Tax=Chromera velia CCMP2878 TaxID=1169474 RepID=A0A0K6SAS7_9ALVE|eukprot:Cvel_10689.t2-p1 / transcript=Cvel_10689.t2 / gene=Cvel_10689 / organism=Chromera_velia_CCMP2878 / gene_product=hypothetical protein / transcript_product=hypothetical protein / location=Cvel_scaffold650:6617-12222(-) / protein_length=258 / sequence_SO=supercontig / SO=protein_coding / is_pseudo=false